MATLNIDAIPAYRGNQLIEACGPILSHEDIAKKTAFIPQRPEADIPKEVHLRRHMVPAIWDLYIPSVESIKIAETVDLLIRQSYARYRPGTPEFWQRLYDRVPKTPVKPLSAAVQGLAGVGKSVAIGQALNLYPQFVDHGHFPGYVNNVRQLIWLKVDAPESGKLIDLAKTLLMAIDRALGTDYLDSEGLMGSGRGPDLFHVWLKIALKHSLGILVIDEIQNLFKLPLLKDRLKTSGSKSQRRELRIVEDGTLKHLLTALNTWGIPIIFAGTPDGIEAFNTRMSTIQRITTFGFHDIPKVPSASDKTFRHTILPILCKYQWVNDRLSPSDDLSHVIFELSGGVPRIYTALWVAAHRSAFDKGVDALSIDTFKSGFRTYMKALAPAVEALNSKDPSKLDRYQDAFPKEFSFWNQFR